MGDAVLCVAETFIEIAAEDDVRAFALPFLDFGREVCNELFPGVGL
jgi:hypothetical protein